MSNEQSIDSNQNEEKIKVYDNDDAYLFGDTSINESNEENEEKDENSKQNNKDNINNKNNLIHPKQKSNKLASNVEEEVLQENEKNNYETPKNYENNEKNNNIESEPIEEDNNYLSAGNISKEDQLLTNKKYIINDITTDMENEQENEDSNNNVSIKLKENKVNNYNKESRENENENPSTHEIESNESEVPLITLNFLSICQCCKNQFNSQNNIPYLFKCGHFFCKQCIEDQFTDEEGIKCPNDGLIAKFISDLKILNNFINDKPVIKNQKYKEKYCEYHKGQKLTHYIENTNEFICVYCAFEKFKSNPEMEIKDILEKCKSMENKIESIIEENQQNVEIIQNSLRDIKINKENEEKKLDEVFNDLLVILKIKKEELKVKIENIFKENAKKLSQKLEIFSNKLEKSEKIKNQLSSFQKNQEEISFSQLIDIYDNFIKEDEEINKITLQKYKYIFDNKMELKELIERFGKLVITEKNFNLLGKILQNNVKENIINNNNNNQQLIRVNKELNINNDNNNSYKIDNFYHFINNKNKQYIKETSFESNKCLNNNKGNDNIIKNLNIQINYKSNLNKSSGNIKIDNVSNKKIINKSKNKSKDKCKEKVTKNYSNNKNIKLLDMTSSTYGNSLSKIENHNKEGIIPNKKKSIISKYKYNLSLGQNYSFNNIPYLNSIHNNQKINNLKTNIKKNNNSKSKNNKSITTPSRINLKKDCK